MGGTVPAPGRRHGRWGRGLGVVVWCPGVVVEGGSCSEPRDRLRLATICFPGTGVVEHHLIVLLAILFAFTGGASYMEVRIPPPEVWSSRENGELHPRSDDRFTAWGVSHRNRTGSHSVKPRSGDRLIAWGVSPRKMNVQYGQARNGRQTCWYVCRRFAAGSFS